MVQEAVSDLLEINDLPENITYFNIYIWHQCAIWWQYSARIPNQNIPAQFVVWIITLNSPVMTVIMGETQCVAC